jgi:hypothetical protein
MELEVKAKPFGCTLDKGTRGNSEQNTQSVIYCRKSGSHETEQSRNFFTFLAFSKFPELRLNNPNTDQWYYHTIS